MQIKNILLPILLVGATAWCGYVLFQIISNVPFGNFVEPEIIIPENLQLETTLDKILLNEEVDVIECDENGLYCQIKGKEMRYWYIPRMETLQEFYGDKIEDINRRTPNSQSFKKEIQPDKDIWVTKVYTAPVFYQKPTGKWYEIKVATTSISAWNTQIKLLGINFGATTKVTVGSSDGMTAKSSNVLATAKACDADTTHPALNRGAAHYTLLGGNYYVRPIFLPYYTAPIPDGDTISSSTLCFYVTTDTNTADNDDIAVAESNQAATTTIALSDHCLVGDVALGTVAAGGGAGWYSITLNQYGMISKTTTTQFAVIFEDYISGGVPTGQNRIQEFEFSEGGGGTSYILVEHAAAPTAAPVEILPDPIMFDF